MMFSPKIILNARSYRQLVVVILVSVACPIATAAQTTQPPSYSYTKYIDDVSGRTVNDLVKLAIENNGELIAIRKEAEAGESLVKQARLRPNPNLEVSGEREVGGMGDNNMMVEGGLPLELGGRRSARIRVAERELEIRKQAAAERERLLAADVRTKFGEALAAILKLKFIEEIVEHATENFNLVAAQVTEGRRPPLEQNMESVELNKMRAMRESNEAAAEMRMLELRNLVGLSPEDPLRVRGDFEDLLGPVSPEAEAAENAIRSRPDLVGARALEQLAAARIEQARSEGRIDADVMLGYQRSKTAFPQMGIDMASGALVPIESRMNFFTFGVRLNLPVRNRNQGLIAAAQSEADAARSRREFGELTVKREVASAYARYSRALRAKEIYRVGVREQSAANLAVVRQTYELGSKTMLDYIAEHHRFMETENAYVDAQLEAYLARVDILRAANAPELANR
jgi:cobalt-zinc-cadmium efflux system outer membrane protein